jgi:RimJ/RimL family protein N-acetyltransferase
LLSDNLVNTNGCSSSNGDDHDTKYQSNEIIGDMCIFRDDTVAGGTDGSNSSSCSNVGDNDSVPQRGHGVGTTCKVGWTLSLPYQRCGYATEALNHLLTYIYTSPVFANVCLVTAEMLTDNVASIALARSVGMRPDAYVDNLNDDDNDLVAAAAAADDDSNRTPVMHIDVDDGITYHEYHYAISYDEWSRRQSLSSSIIDTNSSSNSSADIDLDDQH